ncbi:hypothetical protein OEZ85_003511 [Tetradesmus obliquus]|uniref:Uncharacterized protein n=1 Tax=Tetradesmus obliquus TaxID=3088 RepID=A0ABY8UBI7_TETOB|nr:hypothetical protein OEZ85_003511 [Tetradesmus obliquus]
MAWTWDTRYSAWSSQVSIRGVFVLTREESVNNVTTSIQTLRPRVSGYLNLWSKAYPGPGFSGRYDWSGELELSPDPFTEWQDAAELLHTNSSSSNSTNPPAGTRHRILLQDASNATSTGMVPVQGRVAVKESKAPVDPSSSNSPAGTVALDDSGDITLICLNGVCPPSLTGLPGVAETPDSGETGGSGQTQNPVGAVTGMRLLIILLAALVAPAGLAICATGVAAVVLKRRRKEKEDEQARDARLKRLHTHKEGQIAGRQEQQQQQQQQELQLQGRQGVKQSWRSVDGGDASWVPGVSPSPAVLRRSTAGGSYSGSDEFTDANLALQQQQQEAIASSSIERLQPGETGFGSMPGGVNRFAAMVTMPPGRDSMDGFGVERSRGSRWSLAGSVAGMASSVAAAVRFR